MKKKTAYLLISTMLFASMLCGTILAKDKEEKLHLVVLIDNLQNQYSLNLADEITAMCEEEYGDTIDLTLVGSESDVNVQLSQCEDAITQGCDAIIIQPNDSVATGSAVDACNKAGIPVILLSTMTENDTYTAFSGASDVAGGKGQAEYIFEMLDGKGQVANLLGVMGFSAQTNREKGTNEALEEYPDIELVASQTGNWSRAEALTIAEDWLLAYPDLKAILCQNDDMALGVIEACQSQGREDVLVAGVDGTGDALQAIKDGTLVCTMYQDAKSVGRGAVELALAAINGEPFEKDNYHDLLVVDASNVDEFIK